MSGQLRECQAFAVVDKEGVVRVDSISLSELDAWRRFIGNFWDGSRMTAERDGWRCVRVTVSSAGFEAGIAAEKVSEELAQADTHGAKIRAVAKNPEVTLALIERLQKQIAALRSRDAALSPGGIEAGEAERLLREARHWLAQVSDRVDMPDDLLDQIDAHLSARGGK